MMDIMISVVDGQTEEMIEAGVVLAVIQIVQKEEGGEGGGGGGGSSSFEKSHQSVINDRCL